MNAVPFRVGDRVRGEGSMTQQTCIGRVVQMYGDGSFMVRYESDDDGAPIISEFRCYRPSSPLYVPPERVEIGSGRTT